MQSRSATAPTGEESLTPVTQPSGLRELSTSMVIEPEKKLEAIQRAQVGSLMEPDKAEEPPEKNPKKQSPTLAARRGWKLKLVWACTPPPKKTLIVLILPLMLSTMLIQVAPACTWMWPTICWPSMERRLTLGQASSMIKVSKPVGLYLTFPPGWDTLLSGECNA